MDIFSEIPNKSSPGAVALGTFDGLHPGHTSIIERAITTSSERDCYSAVFTFNPDPELILGNKEPTDRRLLTRNDKMNILDKLGVDAVYEVEFDVDFASIRAEQFINEFLVNRLNLVEVNVGYNFRFGHKRNGDTSLLKKRLNEYGIELSVHDPVKVNGEPVSSTRIRQLIRAGQVKQAWDVLNRPYVIYEEIVPGDQRGQEIGFPTLNFPVRRTIHPLKGVYLVWLGTRERIPAVANFGVHPTVGQTDEPILEVHALEDSVPFEYGDETHVYFGDFLRGEQDFESIEKLKLQIRDDVEQAEKQFKLLSRPDNLTEQRKMGTP